MNEIVGCPVVGLTVKERGTDQPLKFPARSAVRTRQNKGTCGSSRLGGITTSGSLTPPRKRMKPLGKSDPEDTWKSHASTSDTSPTPDPSIPAISPPLHVAASPGLTSAGG